MSGDWVRTGEAARILGLHPHTVKHWSDRGWLPVYRLGPRQDRYYRRAELLAYLERSRG